MSNKIYIIIEYAYLAFAAFSVYLVISNWNIDRGQSYLFLGFVALFVFLFFFRRNFRKRLEQRNKNK
ncbi:MAG: hypothetical protein ABJM06_13575 [Gilvibacter sp.]